jgi:hypothetical protein
MLLLQRIFKSRLDSGLPGDPMRLIGHSAMFPLELFQCLNQKRAGDAGRVDHFEFAQSLSNADIQARRPDLLTSLSAAGQIFDQKMQ